MITVPDVLVAAVLFSCVPLQYFITQNWGLSSIGRTYALNGIFKHLAKLREMFEWNTWINLLGRLTGSTWGSSVIDDFGESPALEVMKYKQKEGFYGFSTEVRSYRSPDIEFRVGQVIYHKNWKYRGVIVGWDENAKASTEWIEVMHGGDKKLGKMPNYSILVDIRDRLTPQFTYVPQEHLEILTNTKIIHPLTEDYFEDFDGGQYLPRPWLKTLYPQD